MLDKHLSGAKSSIMKTVLFLVVFVAVRTSSQTGSVIDIVCFISVACIAFFLNQSLDQCIAIIKSLHKPEDETNEA
ncbi:TPA: hypothetical protein ACN376_004032 [Vibrio parahaemolyticus]